MKKILLCIFLSVAIIFGGCSKKEVVVGAVDKTIQHEGIEVTVGESQVREWLIESDEDGDTQVVFQGEKIVLVEVNLNIEEQVDNMNFYLKDKTQGGEKFYANEHRLKFNKIHRLIKYDETKSGKIEGCVYFNLKEV